MKALIDRIISQAGSVVLDKEHEIRLALACLLARGHLLSATANGDCCPGNASAAHHPPQ